MLSVTSAAHSSIDHETQHGLNFPDHDYVSWEFPCLIFEPESNQISPNSSESNHGSIRSTDPVTKPTELLLKSKERRLKRMKSNRESAHRSRMRKQTHLDNMRNEVNHLNFTNRELSNRLRFVYHTGLTIRSENQRLRTEHTMLRLRLVELQNVLIFQQITRINDNKNNIVGGFGYTRMNEPMGNRSVIMEKLGER